MKNPIALIYTRVSSDSQVESTSLDQQEAFCKEYCKRNNYNPLKTFREEGESARFIDRTELKRALEFCSNKKNLVAFFIVYKFDRFSRSTENHLTIKAILSKYGVRLISITEPIEDNPSGRFFETILAAAAQFDNEVRIERTVNGMKSKLEKGYWLWDPPTGYIRKPGSKLIVPHPIYFDQIKEGWQKLLSGGYRMAEVLSYLQDLNVRSVYGNPIDRKRLSRIFRNEFYAGIVYSNGMQIRAKGKHKPMISEVEFNIAQQILSQNKGSNTGKLGINSEFPLAKTIRCTGCSNVLSGCFSKGKNKYYGYYQCGHSGCKRRQSIPKNDAESAFRELLDNIVPPREDLKLFKDIVVDTYTQQFENSLATKESKLLESKAVRNKLDKLKDLLESGVYGIEEYKERKAKYEVQLTGIEIETNEASIDAKEMEVCINFVTEFIEHLPTFWNNLHPMQKPKLHSLLFPKGLIYQGGTYQTPEINPVLVTIQGITGKNNLRIIGSEHSLPPRGLEPRSAR